MRELVPGLRYTRLHSGHMIHFYSPGSYVREIRAFVAGITAAS